MNQEEVQNFADNNNLDVRPIQENHYRLINSFGKYILDIYFKKNKRGVIVKNSTLDWKRNKWSVANSVSDLNKILNN